jgi:Flp pilus assembly protein CpaB
MSGRSIAYRGVAVAAIGLAGYSGFQGLRDARTVDAREGRSVGVCRAARDIALGEAVTSDQCSPTSLRTRSLPPSAIRRAGDLNQRVVVVPMVRGTVITERHLAQRSRTPTDAIVPSGMRAVRVTPTDGFTPAPGALVDVLAVAEAPFGSTPAATIVARRATVVADPLPADQPSVTLVVGADQATRIAAAHASGAVTLAVVPPDEGRPGSASP